MRSSHRVGQKWVYSCKYTEHSLLLYYCLLIIVLFSTWTTVNLLLPTHSNVQEDSSCPSALLNGPCSVGGALCFRAFIRATSLVHVYCDIVIYNKNRYIWCLSPLPAWTSSASLEYSKWWERKCWLSLFTVSLFQALGNLWLMNGGWLPQEPIGLEGRKF